MKKEILFTVMVLFCLQFIYGQAGQVDPSFGSNGIVKTEIPLSVNPVFQKDGKIVVAGSEWNGRNYDFAVARYNTDGTLDKTFSNDGTQTTDFSSKNDGVVSVALQPDGKIVVAGNTVNNETGNGDSGNDSTVFSVARFNTDGSLDNTFSKDGKVQTDFFNNGRNQAKSMVIQSDGKIALVGSSVKTFPTYPYIEGNSVIVRYNINGSLDKTYNGSGKQTVLFNFVDDENDYLEPFGGVISAVIQPDDKIVVSGSIPGNADYIAVLVRINSDGSLDNTFGRLGTMRVFSAVEGEGAFAIAIQSDGKIVISGFSYYRGDTHDIIQRLNIDGSTDINKSIGYSYGIYDGIPAHSNFVAGQVNGKVVSGGVNLHVYNADGSFDSTFISNGKPPLFSDVAIEGNKLYAVIGNNKLVRYFLNDGNNTPPTVSLTAPTNNTTHLAPANIRLTATALDADGSISKVEFYNGTHLLHTEYVTPYGFKMRDLPVGNYTFTAKAYDNSGIVTTSAPVHISVVPNKPPIVSITKPVVKQTVAAPGYIHLEADAKDLDGRIARVEFYNGSTLLRTEYEAPYTYHWANVPKGTYTITAVAVDNWAARTTSAPVTIRVVSPPVAIVNRPDKTDVNDLININLAPNPATNTVTIYTKGLKQNEPATISVISASGVEMKVMQTNSSTKTVQLDVSSFVNGTYIIKLRSGNKVLYKQFVKL